MKVDRSKLKKTPTEAVSMHVLYINRGTSTQAKHLNTWNMPDLSSATKIPLRRYEEISPIFFELMNSFIQRTNSLFKHSFCSL